MSHHNKCIFVHIPKTGGTSIEAALSMHGDIADVGLVPQAKIEKDFDHFFGGGLQHLTA